MQIRGFINKLTGRLAPTEHHTIGADGVVRRNFEKNPNGTKKERAKLKRLAKRAAVKIG